MLEIRNATCGYNHNAVVNNISFSVSKGEVICILGANGIGKTTLFKSILGSLALLNGEILLNNKNIRSISNSELARSIGYVPQAHTPPFPFSVLDVVVMGRTAHLSIFSSPSQADMNIAKKALNTLNISHLEDKIYTEISGGERQLVLIARALAQNPEILIMDEPTANLDFGNQINILNTITSLAKEGLSVVLTTHFPDHVFFCSTKVVVIKSENEVLVGKAEEVITQELLKTIYGIKIAVKKLTLNNRDAVVCVPC